MNRASLTFALVLLSSAAHAEYACMDYAGRLFWQKMPCAQSHLRDYSSTSQHQGCPDGYTISVLQREASRRDLSAGDRAVAKAEWERASACKPKLTAQEKSRIFGGGFAADAQQQRSAQRRAAAQAPAPPALITNCDGGGCWDTNGNRYNGQGSTLFRTDGKTCIHVGNQLECH